MFHLITGGSGSGKSAFAEREICRLQAEAGDGKLYYVATMYPYGEETLQKISRHQKMRAGKGFQTLECYTGLSDLADRLQREEGEKRPCILLECMSNLTANELYMETGAGQNGKEAAEEILKGVYKLNAFCRHLVIVTNEVFSDVPISQETEQYLSVLGEVNRRMAKAADRVTEVVCGIQVEVKG